MKPTAAITLRREPAFRAEAFAAGLAAAGYAIKLEPATAPKPDDVLVIWNRYMTHDRYARRYEDAGAKVIVAENGYLGREWRGGIWYSLALGHHNGAGVWPDGGPHRWDSWGVDLKPWRNGGAAIVVLAQRGIGHPQVKEPFGWSRQALSRLSALTKRRVRFRPHPGEKPPKITLEADLADAWAVVTWGSAAALKALVMGVPAFHGFPRWIGAAAAARWPGDLEAPFRGDRLPAFRRLAWAIWSVPEIASGEPFRCLLR